ncbi:lysophospholipid acyltransferase family protein [Corynebacterium aquilae]|uniref:Acyl-phosphate glycerol 3-phosphate acyltransferase n=1 Tax=Corynebacterium aquilae DSM 44791 TaxID=1431546 RepID=A0A1L7CH88_9CORY|nr:lysophospholipid acyltransferase family protein [Corynebacterium aquilae]APT85113.1 acyl-phosphate glycerol 3-phosphate acyltransferase [Corynebacterium aquilae DSM 44791]
MHNKWYWVFKNILFGPALRVYNRPEITGLSNLPSSGPAILASNHQSVMDSFYLPLLVSRQITFLAKSEYFTGTGFVGALQRWFFTSVGQVPIERGNESAAKDALDAAEKVLAKGDVLGIYPEGTRSPDGRIYKAKTGMARIALNTGAPIVPVAMFGSRKANPIGSWIVRPAKVRIALGAPIDPIAYVESKGLDPASREAQRALADHVQRILTDMTGNEYVDMYAADVKAHLAQGLGYPEGAEPSSLS